MTNATRLLSLILASVVMTACAREDPARAALRERLKVEDRLNDEELTRFMDEVQRSVEGKSFQIREGSATRQLDDEQRAFAFGMLGYRNGAFDQGLLGDGDARCRLINAPGVPYNDEIESTRRLCVDLQTFLPSHFEFFYAIPGLGDYAFDLTAE